MTKRANSIRSKLLMKSPQLLIKKGDVVLVPLDDVDRTKVDGGNVCGVVVSVNKLNSSCRVAVAQGTSSPCICVSYPQALAYSIKQY